MLRFSRLLIAGTGEVVAQRIRPALKCLAGWHPLEAVTYFDVATQPTQFQMGDLPIPERFLQVRDSDTAVHQLTSQGVLGRDTLLWICTPSPLHVPYARLFAEFVGRVGVEKPLSLNPCEAAALVNFEGRVFPTNHQLCKPAMQCWSTDCESGRFDVRNLGRIEFWLHETKGVGNQATENAIWDLSWHGFVCALSPLFAVGLSPSIEIQDVQVATYVDGPDHPRRSTAARIEALLRMNELDIPLTISVGKGQTHGHKVVQAYDRSGDLLRVVCLNDPDNRGHRLALRELLTAKQPTMQLGLREVIRVVKACDIASARAIVMPHYFFGASPDWLKVPNLVKEPVAA